MNSARKLKVLHLTSHLDMGGITRYIQLLGTAMSRRGHAMAVLSAGGALESELEKNGIKAYRLPVRKKSILDPSLYASLRPIARLIREEKYDLLHAHTRVTQALSFFLKRGQSIPTVSTCHGFFNYNLGRRLFPCWGDRVVAISGPVAEELKSTHHVPEPKIRVVGNAIDLQEAQVRFFRHYPKEVRLKYKIPENAVTLCCAARFVKDKGHEILLRAVAELLPFFPDIYLLLAGDGREKENLEDLITELGISRSVVILPNFNDISELLSVTDIFVHPAYCREGFGLGIAEAMAVRRPVVLADIPAVNTLFRPGECCVMARPADVSSLAGAIRFLMEAPQEKARIAEAGYQLVQSLCSMDRMADQMEAVYRELVLS